jgi:uncharacterized membrane protein
MKRILLTLLAVVVVIGLVGAVGFAGYRYGFAQGAQLQRLPANGDATRPGLRNFDDFDRGRMPMHNFGFDRRGPSGMFFPMMGFGLFGPLRLLMWIVVLALLVWFIYWLVTRSGWRLTRETVNAPPANVETKRETLENE